MVASSTILMATKFETIENFAQDKDAKVIWTLVMRYNFEDIGENYTFESDPKMHAIWSLRGDELRYFLDFKQALNMAEQHVGPNSVPFNHTLISNERRVEIISLVEADMFGLPQVNEKPLSVSEINYVSELKEGLAAIMSGTSDLYFDETYVIERDVTILYIEDTNARLFTQITDGSNDEYLQLLEDLKSEVNTTNIQANSSCSSITTDSPNVTPNFSLAGTHGFYWEYRSIVGQSDCDIAVRYSNPSRMNFVDGDTSDGYCVVNYYASRNRKITSKYEAYNLLTHIIYGDRVVEWPWITGGCNTTGGAVQSGTDATP